MPVQRNIINLGKKTISLIRYVGAVSVLIGNTFLALFHGPFRIRQALKQVAKIGVESLPIVSLIPVDEISSMVVFMCINRFPEDRTYSCPLPDLWKARPSDSRKDSRFRTPAPCLSITTKWA